ncbi:PA2778 family cysteine peptidase [Sulfurovum sp.]|uniref:PA2778 family cysteine peptidase n=1 Tax=Sulfurovum sp. TaxID=1969726 RepID=UPI002A35E284|nr:PA2778 family cysteine peptidase [Sulfurovum sp.]MDY0403149.1 PA2778 family cysteine peptidase [Sulfurovum sp.]
MKRNRCTRFLPILALLLMLVGCGPKEPLPPSGDHINVPFVAPRSDLCAATSIEMVSKYWQSKTSYTPRLSQTELDARTLIPEKGGTLQIELMATSRANGLLAYTLEPTFDALLRELKEQHPVIVLLNRSYAWYPLWHYAPVTGYDKQNQTISMHFSDQPNEAISVATFKRLWERSGNWGVVLLPPGYLPATASPEAFLRAAYDLEKTGISNDAIIAYKRALERWPKEVDLLFALANACYNAKQFAEAEKYYRRLLSIEPNHPLALNNLADLLCHRGRQNEAMAMIKKAVSDNSKIQSIINATQKEILKGCTHQKKKEK